MISHSQLHPSVLGQRNPIPTTMQRPESFSDLTYKPSYTPPGFIYQQDAYGVDEVDDDYITYGGGRLSPLETCSNPPSKTCASEYPNLDFTYPISGVSADAPSALVSYLLQLLNHKQGVVKELMGKLSKYENVESLVSENVCSVPSMQLTPKRIPLSLVEPSLRPSTSTSSLVIPNTQVSNAVDPQLNFSFVKSDSLDEKDMKAIWTPIRSKSSTCLLEEMKVSIANPVPTVPNATPVNLAPSAAVLNPIVQTTTTVPSALSSVPHSNSLAGSASSSNISTLLQSQTNSSLHSSSVVGSASTSNISALLQNSSSTLFEQKELKTTFKALIDKIIKTNDQPCSIFLQQRIRLDVHNGVTNQLLPLTKNRFGNFLVQCCFEYANNEQISLLIQKMKGHVVSLGCDRFGCHVMQKVSKSNQAMEKCDEENKWILVQEMSNSIPDSFTHRFACHVWQRIFETKWSCSSRFQALMKTVNDNVKDWKYIAGDENGSLVVQCIFEHCDTPYRKPITDQLFQDTAAIAQGQWGNWVIQHLLENGTAEEQRHIISVVLQHVFEMSIDQYASKVVEKCVRIASKPQLLTFIHEITVPDKSGRVGILEMMNHQYGNYVVQNVLSIAETSQRDICVKLIAPHVHVLKLSKYGQRVATLVEKYLRMTK